MPNGGASGNAHDHGVNCRGTHAVVSSQDNDGYGPIAGRPKNASGVCEGMPTRFYNHNAENVV